MITLTPVGRAVDVPGCGSPFKSCDEVEVLGARPSAADRDLAGPGATFVAARPVVDVPAVPDAKVVGARPSDRAKLAKFGSACVVGFWPSSLSEESTCSNYNNSSKYLYNNMSP